MLISVTSSFLSAAIVDYANSNVVFQKQFLSLRSERDEELEDYEVMQSLFFDENTGNIIIAGSYVVEAKKRRMK